MKSYQTFCFAFVILLMFACDLRASVWDPTATNYSGNRGTTLYVSKLGDNSDGSSWEKAFHSIQAALSAIPNNKGGHQIIVRPDTYVEANLAPSHPGASGAYNALIGDFDGSLGSGAKGWVLIDSGDPQKGFKSWDWWSTMRASEKNWGRGNDKKTFSSIVCDRWIFRNLYTAGGDAGLFWDLTDKSGEEFTVVVEDCVATGRAFGGGVCYPVVRPNEPCAFRRCYFLALDYVGDTAAVLLGGWEKTMPESPHAVFEDCIMVHPDNAVATSYASHCARAKFTNCRMIVLNFTQPEMGGQSTGILCTQGHSPTGRLHVDLKDCILAGYSVATPGEEGKALSYTTEGTVQAYVQFKQSLPAGFTRLGIWPTDLFAQIAPPRTPEELKAQALSLPTVKKLTKLSDKLGGHMETTPVWFQDRLLSMQSHREDLPTPNLEAMHLLIRDMETGKDLVKFGKRHSLASAFVEGDTLHVFAAEHGEKPSQWFGDIYHFTTTDLKHWDRELAIPRAEGEGHLLNSSVCRDEQGYLMAYESDTPVGFCFKFARSKDLSKWEKIDNLVFAGVNGAEYSACPVIRYFKPYYYVIYLHREIPGHSGHISFIARSKDLTSWQLSPMNPILEAGEGEGCNNSDVDLIELSGRTLLYYACGNQADWCELRSAVYPGPMREFFESYFPAGVSMETVQTKREAAEAKQ